MRRFSDKARHWARGLKSKAALEQGANASVPGPELGSVAPYSSTELNENSRRGDSGINHTQVAHLEVFESPAQQALSSGAQAQAQSSDTLAEQAFEARNNGGTSNNDKDSEDKEDCWTRALRKIDKKHLDPINEIRATNTLGDVSENVANRVKLLLKDTQALQQKRESERDEWLFQFLGKDIPVRRLLDGVMETLLNVSNKIERAAEIATSVDPLHSVGPYLLFRTLLQVCALVSSCRSRSLRSDAESLPTYLGVYGELSPRRSPLHGSRESAASDIPLPGIRPYYQRGLPIPRS